MNKSEIIWALMPVILSIASAAIAYVKGKAKARLKVPAPVAKLLGDGQVMDLIIKGVAEAGAMQALTEDQKREYVRKWAKAELYKLLGDWLPDRIINMLIEAAIVRIKA